MWSGGLIKSYGIGTDRTPSATGIVTSVTAIANDSTEEAILANAVPANEPVTGAQYQGKAFGILDTTASSPTLQTRLRAGAARSSSLERLSPWAALLQGTGRGRWSSTSSSSARPLPTRD